MKFMEIFARDHLWQ